MDNPNLKTIVLKLVLPADTARDRFTQLAYFADGFGEAACQLHAHDAGPDDLKLYKEWAQSQH